jgi:hypothetical protein
VQSTRPNIFALIEHGLEVAERIEQLGPIGAGALAWQALPLALRERVLGQCCPDCRLAASLCECCESCGWTPCACPSRFPRTTYEAEGVSVE